MRCGVACFYRKFPIVSLLLTSLIFFVLALIAHIYQLNITGLNLWGAIAVALTFNPLKLQNKEWLVWSFIALISALLPFYLSAQIFGVWIFVLFLAFAPILKRNHADVDFSDYGLLLIFSAFFFNLSLISNTSHTDIQYDFASCFNYIEYILDNNFLFWNENPLLTRPSYSTYHPILHFFLAAAEIRFTLIFTDNMQIAAETAQVAFCCYMLWYYLICNKILRLFKLQPLPYFCGLLLVIFFPAYNAISGFFNNDCLLLPLQAGTIYYSLLYYQNGERKNLIYLFIFATLAALTKLSAIVVLPLTAVVLLLRLIQHNDKQTWLEIGIFCVFLLGGLAIWPLYQHFFLHVGADFVPPQEHLSLEPYSYWQRFNPLGAFFYTQMFYNDFGINLWETMTKTALFGQWDFSYRGQSIMPLIYALVWIFKAILLLLWGVVIYFIFCKRTTNSWLAIVLLMGILAGQVAFGLMHPYMCNQDFRYVAIITLAWAILLAQFCNSIPRKGQVCVLILVSVFAFLSAFIWWRISF